MNTTNHYNVYVVELSESVLRERKFVRANPRYDLDKPCLYVGMTGLTPEERFDNHKKGHKSNRYVRDFGIRLCPKLYEKYNPMTYEDACTQELELAALLRSQGYPVWQK